LEKIVFYFFRYVNVPSHYDYLIIYNILYVNISINFGYIYGFVQTYNYDMYINKLLFIK